MQTSKIIRHKYKKLEQTKTKEREELKMEKQKEKIKQKRNKRYYINSISNNNHSLVNTCSSKYCDINRG